MTWVKICGITNLEDALTAVEAGADAVGFVFHPESPRNVYPQEVGNIAEKLPPSLDKVGVFVNGGRPIVEMKRIIHQAGLTAIQIHSFDPTPNMKIVDDLSPLAAKLFIAWPADFVFHGRLGAFKWRSESESKVSAIFLDSGTPIRPGGTGTTFDWEKAAPVLTAIDGDVRFVVAGGLNSENVSNAIRALKPFGVDVSSGVEARPGKKDPAKVKAFVEAVRRAEKTRIEMRK